MVTGFGQLVVRLANILAKGQILSYLGAMTDQVSQYLGQNVLELRRKKSFSQKALADLAGIPRSTLTHIESGSGNPSLHNLLRLSESLGVNLEELLARPRSDIQVLKREEIRTQLRSSGQVIIQKLLPEPIKGIEIDRLEFAPQAVMGGQPHLAGTKEYMTVIRGEVEVRLQGEFYKVSKGDVIAFPGDQKHSYHNKKSVVALVLSVVIPIPLIKN